MTEYITKDDAMRALGVDRHNWTSPNNAEAWWACSEMRIAIKENIENIPPITDFERHGRWILYGDAIFCSECDFSVSGGYAPKVFRYCPHCGTRMDGEFDE